jgi:hypothetical protein
METGLPGQFVTDVEFDPYHPDSMFCTVSGYRNAVYSPFIFRAAIGGEWQPIQGDLPEHPVNQIHALNDSVWVIATDAGVFATFNRGANWQPVGTLPTIPVYDVDADTITNRLIAGTFARSLLSFPLDSLLPAPEVVEPNAVENFEEPAYWAYPNPFTSTLNLSLEKDVKSVRVVDFSGRIVHEQNVANALSLVVPSGAWPAGKYIVVMETATGPRSLQVIKGQ